VLEAKVGVDGQIQGVEPTCKKFVSTEEKKGRGKSGCTHLVD
jgi:hypothetical protein